MEKQKKKKKKKSITKHTINGEFFWEAISETEISM